MNQTICPASIDLIVAVNERQPSVAGDAASTRVSSGADAGIRLPDHPHARVADPLGTLRGRVSTTVINDYHLVVGTRRGENTGDCTLDSLLAIERWYDDTQARTRSRRHDGIGYCQADEAPLLRTTTRQPAPSA